MTARGLIIAAPRSGSGKTTLTLAILAAARRRGVRVRAAKAGPDYIDPAFHAVATGQPSFNLDSWAMAPAQLAAVAQLAAQDAELVVIESAMGLFDGVVAKPGRSGAGADLAAGLGLPVLLVLDVSGQSQTAAAIARGFVGHAPGVTIAGVILNRFASERHREGVAAAMSAIDMPVLGSLPRNEKVVLPERHLGLVQALEHPDLGDYLGRLADLADQYLDLEKILALAAPLEPFPIRSIRPDRTKRALSQYVRAFSDGEPVPTSPENALAPARGAASPLLAPPGQRIALARDEAFSFLYPHLLEGWRRAGGEIVFFSPLADEAPPADCDSCWLPGGYPELHAERLAGAARFRRGLEDFARNRTVHAECGGYMVLGESLQTADGVRHRMTGLLSHATSFAQRRLNLGYRRAVILADSPIGPAGSAVRGHEFHYATTTDPGTDAPLATLSDALGRDLGPCGGRRGPVTGAFFHAIASDVP